MKYLAQAEIEGRGCVGTIATVPSGVMCVRDYIVKRAGGADACVQFLAASVAQLTSSFNNSFLYKLLGNCALSGDF